MFQSVKLPKSLEEIHVLKAVLKQNSAKPDELKNLFPKTLGQPFVEFEKGQIVAEKPLRVGVVFSGGQASGGHNVISGLFDALKKIDPKSRLFGFLGGPSGIVDQKYIEITEELLAPYRNQGGFDLIGSGRTKIETEEQFEKAEKAASELDLDGLVIIGGDDSNTNAALLAEHFQCKTRVIGVPKTIDGDLKTALVETSFGFDTATKTFSETIGSLAKDALSAKKYTFFVKLMGRSASHVALECALQTHPNLTLIAEEERSFKELVEDIANMVSARSRRGKNYGIVLIPEGIIEFIPEFKELIKELNRDSNIEKLTQSSRECFDLLPELIQKQLLLDRDPHGNITVSQIETERLFIEAVKQELKKRGFKGKFSPLPLFCGYEGRSCYPSHFDANYCYALGHVASLLIKEGLTGYMACVSGLKKPVDQWGILGVPLTSMIHMEERKGKMKPVIEKALVDLQDAAYQEFKQNRDSWMLEDDYRYPGPIQFFGPEELTERITRTLEVS